MKTPVKVYVGAEFIAEGFVELPEKLDPLGLISVRVDGKQYWVKRLIEKEDETILFCRRVWNAKVTV